MINVTTCFTLDTVECRQEDILSFFLFKMKKCQYYSMPQDISEALRCHEKIGQPDDDRDDSMRPTKVHCPAHVCATLAIHL